MNRLYAHRYWIYAVLAALLLTDGWIYFYWINPREAGPQVTTADVKHLEAQVEQLAQEVARLRRVREQLPRLDAEINKFISEHFVPDAGGFSAIATDLQRFAGTARVELKRISYKTDERQERPDMRKVQVSTTVEAAYPNVLKYLEELEGASRFYLVDDVETSSSRGRVLRVEIRLSTYFGRGVS